jgi:FkbM family methyltransferase
MSDTTFVSYAQNAEDVVLWRALGHIKDGRYVDVGANHPHTDSVTQAFYERGWRGITVEPLPDQAALQRRERPLDTQVEVAVSDTDDETVVLHSVPGSGLSSIVDEVGDRNRREGRQVEDIPVSTQTLTRILDDSGDDLGDIHFMVIDVEGAEAQALARLDLHRWRPWVMVVEATRPNSTEPSYQAWERHLTDAGYVFCLFDGLSRFYVAAEHQDALGASLSYPACVFDDYIPRRYLDLQRDIERLQDTERELVRWRHRALIEWSAIAAEAADSEGLARELKDVRESMSWRVTRPLRFARRAMGRLR